MAYWLKVITALLIIGCIELNPGPKRQATLTNIPHSTPDQAPMDDLKLLIINLSAEVNRLGEKMDARLLNIEQKMEVWERRMAGIETSMASCTDALATNTRLISHNTLKIRNLEERAEALERRARENNLIIYGIESAETDSRELLLQKVKKLMAEDMQITDDVVIAECHRLGRGPKAPILIEVPDHESRISLLKNSFKLRMLNIFMSRDYSPQIREQRKILIEKRKELYKKGIGSKLRDNKLLLNGINYMVVEGQFIGPNNKTENCYMEPKAKINFSWSVDKIPTYIETLKELTPEHPADSTIDTQAENFTGLIQTAMLLSGTRMEAKTKNIKSKPWFDKDCYLAKKEMKQNLKLYVKHNISADKIAYLSSKKKYSAILKLKKREYTDKIQVILSNVKDPSQFWKTINSLKYRNNLQGEISTADWQVFYRELLGSNLTKIVQLPLEILDIDPELDCEISLTEVTKEISKLGKNKATGLDEIPNEAIKYLLEEHTIYLRNLFNKILGTSQVPQEWTKTIIHPIFKNGDPDNPSNYRGISLISNLSKLFTSILKTRLNDWMERKSILAENQAGFRKGYSCQDHIFTLVSLIQMTLSRRRGKLYAFFIDLRKAFDTVPHHLLWKKLALNGLSCRFIKLIKNYYTQMTATVRWRGSFTEAIKIQAGVLQGEPLSPYLFILFLNDLVHLFDESELPGINLENYGTIHLLLYAEPGAPILVEVPEQNDRTTLFKAAFNLRGTKISLSKDYSMKMREQRRVLNVKRRELVEKGTLAKLRDNKLIINGIAYKVCDGQIVDANGHSLHIDYHMSEGNEVLIAGDINIRIGNAGGFHNPLKLNSSLNKYRKSKDLISPKLSEKLISFTDSNSITIANGRTRGDTHGSFTFISERGSWVLDYFMYTHGLTQIISDMWIEELSYSYHLPIVLQINTGYEAIKSSYKNEILIRKFFWTKENVEMLKHNLSDIEVGNETDINTETANFTKQIYTAMESANIIKFAKRRHQLSKPWYDKDCYIMKKTTKVSLQRCRNSNNIHDRQKYIEARREYFKLLQRKRDEFNKDKNERIKNAKDSKSFWNAIASFRKKPIIQGEIDIKEWFLFYKNLLNKENKEATFTVNQMIGWKDPDLDAEITLEEIHDVVKKLANGKAVGLDGIPNELLKNLPIPTLNKLKNLFNKIMSTEKYPQLWTNSIVHPIYKSGDKNNPTNYRGIALCSNISKLFTTILSNRLNNWIEKRVIILENQAGFRKNRSCTDHIILLNSLIQLSLRRKRGKLYVFFVDLTKAFDTVPHDLLWQKLHKMGISNKFVMLIKNFYQEAKITIRWKGQYSNNVKINSGVLQGESLSPLLFILYMADLIELYNNSALTGFHLPDFGVLHLLMYADDIAIIGESKINLQIKINLLKSYLDKNKLVLNENKSKIIVFRNGGRPARHENWYWGDTPLTVASNITYLGYPFTSTINSKKAKEGVSSLSDMNKDSTIGIITEAVNSAMENKVEKKLREISVHRPTFAQVTKQENVQQLIVKHQQTQNLEFTLIATPANNESISDVSQAISRTIKKIREDGGNIKINKIFNTRNAVVIKSPSRVELNALQEELGKSDELKAISKIYIPGKRDPTVVVKNVSKITDTTTFVKTICNMNPELRGMEDEIRMLFVMKSNTATQNIVLRLSPKAYQTIKKNNNTLYTDLERCHIQDKILVKQCQKCYQYNPNHKLKDCTNEKICNICGVHGTHSCSNVLSCHNCSKHPIYRNKQTNHRVNGTDCPLYKTQVDRIIDRTQYFYDLEDDNSKLLYPSKQMRGRTFELFKEIDSSTFESTPLVLCGDFNSRHPVWFDRITNSNGYKMQPIINEYNLFIHNNKTPTCRNKSIIDLTISNRHSLKLVNNWQTLELTNISDHVTVSFDINVNLDITNNQQKSTWKFSEKKADWSLFSNTISKQEVRRLENDIKKVEKETDIDMVVDRLTDIILEAAYQSLEVKSSNFTFDTGIKWWNKELEQKKKYFHYVRNLFFHHKAISVNEYKSVRNKYKNSIRKAKRNSWRDFIEENGSNNPFGNAYRTLKKLSSSNQQKGLPIIEQAPVDSKESLIKDLIDELIPDDTTISDTAHHISIRNYTPNFTNSNSCNIHKKEIEEIIDKINVNKAPGQDNISNNMIKNAFQLILPILHSLFNKCIQIGYFPKKWKTAALKIIAKPGKTNYELAKSYRPISLLSNFSKILEKILKNKIYEFYIQNNLLRSRQHGFIKTKSTITALNTVIDVLMEHKQKELSALITIDISGAFDNAWWPAIIKRIDSDNLPEKLIKILQSYLNSRIISFSYDNLTTSKPITKGCPQGGPLSPLLWTILLNDLLLNFQVTICGNPIMHPLPRLPSTFHIGFTTEPVKVDRMTEDSNMQRMTEAGNEFFADALTNMQPHCEDRVSRLKDAMRGLAAPRTEEVTIAPSTSPAPQTSSSIGSNRQTRLIDKSWHCPANQHRRCPMATIAKSDHQASSQPTPQAPFKTSI
ncbi:hypothetical protein LAZ67_2002616, partial [Cordylochernes scorpioides]